MRSQQFLPPWLIQLIGLALLVASAAFWAVTGRASVEFIAASMTLITLGVTAGAYQKAAESRREYERPPKRAPKPKRGGGEE